MHRKRTRMFPNHTQINLPQVLGSGTIRSTSNNNDNNPNNTAATALSSPIQSILTPTKEDVFQPHPLCRCISFSHCRCTSFSHCWCTSFSHCRCILISHCRCTTVSHCECISFRIACRIFTLSGNGKDRSHFPHTKPTRGLGKSRMFFCHKSANRTNPSLRPRTRKEMVLSQKNCDPKFAFVFNIIGSPTGVGVDGDTPAV